MSASPHPALLVGVLAFEAYRVNFFLLIFFADTKTLRDSDVVKLQITISLDAHAIHGIASAKSVDNWWRGWDLLSRSAPH